MTDPSDSPAPPGPQAPPAGSGSAGWRANARFAADIVNTLAVPLLTIAATVVGLYATNSLKQREIAIATESNRQALRNQREESETNLRSAMFRELVGPLLQGQGDSTGNQGDLSRDQRLALLAELLTLNFHEHFELGPLLQYVDRCRARPTKRVRACAAPPGGSFPGSSRRCSPSPPQARKAIRVFSRSR